MHTSYCNEGSMATWGVRCSLKTLLLAAACLLVRKSIFEEVDGLDPSLAVAFLQ